MVLFSGVTLLGLLASQVTAHYKFGDVSATDKLAADGLRNLEEYMKKNNNGKCTLENAIVRREWSDLSDQERIDYNNAVLCLHKKKNISPESLIPGARNRIDDFQGVHIKKTTHIHLTGNFLSWHRYFVWVYETALREECGYQGYQPYWNWGKYAHDLLHSPLFDGSETSLSNDGQYRKHPALNFSETPAGYCRGCSGRDITLYPAQGGGCITAGPYKDVSVHLGPVAPILPYIKPNPQKDGLGYNPRCLRRDINNGVAQKALTDKNSTDLITEHHDIKQFQDKLQSNSGKLQAWGLHGGGHISVGGDPGGDIFASPADPYFFLHHAQVDRTWWIWQNQQIGERYDVIAGTMTLANEPPSRNATLNDTIDIGPNAGPIRIYNAVSTTNGPFCYIYK